MEANEYQCAMCQGAFTKAHSDEEAMTETQTYWPGAAQQDCAVVRDECYQKISPEQHPEEYRDSLLEMEIQQAYADLRGTDNLAEKSQIVNTTLEKICAASAIPPSMIGEALNTNYNVNWEEHVEAYRQRFFGRNKQ